MDKKYVNRNDRILLIVIILAGSVFIYFFMPWFSLYPDACIHRKITGIECPLCGMTHGVYEMLNFRFWKAFQYNQAIPLMVAWFSMECLTLLRPGALNFKLRKISFFAFLTSLGVVYMIRILQAIIPNS